MNQSNKIILTSEAFKNGEFIPVKYSCMGENINPPLLIKNIPEKSKSLALIVDDPDAPSGDWVHWLMWNIPSDTTKIESSILPQNVVQGLNDSRENKYDGPCPPSGTHRYFFKLYALDIILNINNNSSKNALEKAMENHILDKNELMGLFSK